MNKIGETKQYLHKNQFLIKTKDNTRVFKSYDSYIVEVNRAGDILCIGLDWNYSMTTQRHLKAFLEDYGNSQYKSKADFKKLIDQEFILIGEYYYPKEMALEELQEINKEAA